MYAEELKDCLGSWLSTEVAWTPSFSSTILWLGHLLSPTLYSCTKCRVENEGPTHKITLTIKFMVCGCLLLTLRYSLMLLFNYVGIT